jgi:hypothetical protein
MANQRVSELAQITANQVNPLDLILLAHLYPSPLSMKMTMADLSTYILSGGNLTGSFYGTSSWSQTASYSLNTPIQVTASYALIAGNALNAVSATFASSAGNSTTSISASFATIAGIALTASFGIATFATSSTYSKTASFLLFVPGSTNGTASYSMTSSNSQTASYALNAAGSNITSSYAFTSSNAIISQTSSNVLWDGVSNNGTVFNSVSTSYSPESDFSISSSHALVADVAFTSISSQVSASWASSSISSSNAITAAYAITASYFIPTPNTLQYGIFQAITQSVTASQVDVVSVVAPYSLTMSVDVNGSIIIPWTASMLLNESITLNVINRTTGVSHLLDTYPVYINMGNNTAMFSGGLTGSFTGSITSSVQGTIAASIQSTLTGSYNGHLTGSFSASYSGSNGTGSLSGSITGSGPGYLTGSLTGSISGNITGSMSGTMTSSIMANVNGTITNNISGTMVVPFNLMGAVSVYPDNYMIYVKASSNDFSIYQNRNVRFAVDINVGSFSISNGHPLSFYTDFQNPIVFSSSLGGPFTDTYVGINITGSNNIYMMDLSAINGNVYYAWTLQNCSLVQATNAYGLTSIAGMPSNILTMSIQTSSLSQLTDLSYTTLGWLTFTNSSISQLPSLPSSMSYININLNNITNIVSLPAGLTQFYCDNCPVLSLASLSMPSTIVSMSLSSETNLNTLPSSLPNSLAYFWCRNNPLLTMFPALPPNIIYLDVSNDNLSTTVEDGICADIQGSGLSNGYLNLQGNAHITSPTTLARISTLFSRGWTVLYS